MSSSVEILLTRIYEGYIEEDFQENLIILDDEEENKRSNELPKSINDFKN